MRLVHQATGEEVKVGDTYVGRDGVKTTIKGWERPRSPASSGRIYVKDEEGFEASYYPSVGGCEWIEREDRDGGTA